MHYESKIRIYALFSLFPVKYICVILGMKKNQLQEVTENSTVFRISLDNGRHFSIL